MINKCTKTKQPGKSATHAEKFRKAALEAAPLPPVVTTLTRAFNILGKRAMVRDGSFYLDGKACNLTDIMQAANRIQKAMGSEQISANPAWVV